MSRAANLPATGNPPMWKVFLQSMALLVVALLTALYSTAAAASGNLPATLLTTLVSLGLAAWVGIRFVPRLARGVDWGWMPGRGNYRITREGVIFLSALFIVLAAAINTSNNLLYMVLSALLAVLALSGLLSAVNFKALEMQLLLPPRAFAGEAIPFSVRIRNRRRVFPAFSLLTQPPGENLYFPLIQPRQSVLRPGQTSFLRRGRHSFELLRAGSRFPFGFFVKSRGFAVEAECLCYPAIIPEDQLNISVTDILGDMQSLQRGMGSDLYTIRDYVPSDSARHVHWKATAKTAALKTREFAAEESHNIILVLDRYGKPEDSDQFETLVSKAASLAFHLIRGGALVSLVSDNWRCPPEASEASLDAILNYLALVQMSPDAPPPSFHPGTGAFVLSLRDGGIE
ncbi:MAG TPA: DUF58 domain-containing protein [Terriglobia bacterium]|nr:DUF58 domain-containing protein [Terriglobia bacterium]